MRLKAQLRADAQMLRERVTRLMHDGRLGGAANSYRARAVELAETVTQYEGKIAAIKQCRAPVSSQLKAAERERLQLSRRRGQRSSPRVASGPTSVRGLLATRVTRCRRPRRRLLGLGGGQPQQ